MTACNCEKCRRRAEIEREQDAAQATSPRQPGPLPRPSPGELVARFGVSESGLRLLSAAATDAAGVTSQAEIASRHARIQVPQLRGVNAGPIPEGIVVERYREFRGPVRRCAGGCLTPVTGFDIYCPACIPDDWAH